METQALNFLPRKMPCRPAVPLCAIMLLAVCTACSSSQGSLRMVSVDNRHRFSQSFSHAYISRDPTGDADVVLVRDGADPRHDDPNKPLSPDAYLIPRQLVHIRIFWLPLTGKADHPANTNASIRWCLIGNTPEQPSLVVYTGCGLVMIDDTRNGAFVSVRKAWMKPATQRGGMSDPLGPSMLDGSFHALNDPAQVQSLLAQMKQATSPVLEASTPAPGTPQVQLTVNP
jgi:hypothetical protein